MNFEQTAFSRRTSVLLLIATAILWSLGGVLIKRIEWNPVAIAGSRSAVAVLVIVLLRWKCSITWSAAMIAGGCAYAGTVIFFVTATKLTTAANAILIQYTAPVYVALFSAWFLHERIHRIDWMTILAVFAGLALFFLDEIDTSGLRGNISAMFSGICFAWLTLLMRKQKDASPVDSVIIGNIMTALICIPSYYDSVPDPGSWAAIVALGVVQLGLSYFLYALAIRHVRAVEAIMIPMLEPILNPLWVFLFIGERPGVWALVGGTVVMFAITCRGVLSARQNVSGHGFSGP